MNKKVLIVSSSPRKHGNSDLLCDEFARGAKDAGNEVEKVFLADKSINYCRGCGICNSTHKCVQKDDMAELNDKMVKADVIALASPVYFYTVDAQLKAFIDRCVPRYTEMSDKDFYYILTAADSDKSAFVERFPELSLFYRLFSPLNSEMICIFPYFCPYAESAREIREIFS